MSKIIEKIIQTITSKQSYTFFLKLGGIMASAAAIAITQLTPFLYEKDLRAHELQFAVESMIEKPLDDSDCLSLNQAYVADCRLAKYQKETLNSSLKSFMSAINSFTVLGFTFIFIGIIIYFISPFIHERKA